MHSKSASQKPQGPDSNFRMSRRGSEDTVHSGMYPDFWSQLHDSPVQGQNEQEQTFYEKVLPGLSCFAMLEEGQDEHASMRNELDNIDPLLFADSHENDTSPQQFFNYIENESDYERLKNRKFGRPGLTRQELRKRVQGVLRTALQRAGVEQTVRVCEQHRDREPHRELLGR